MLSSEINSNGTPLLDPCLAIQVIECWSIDDKAIKSMGDRQLVWVHDKFLEFGCEGG
jgi:hypothetical protein